MKWIGYTYVVLMGMLAIVSAYLTVQCFLIDFIMGSLGLLMTILIGANAVMMFIVVKDSGK